MLQRAARAVSEWASGASLKLNAGKTKAIVFGSNRYVNSVKSDSSLCIDMGCGTKVPFSDSVESLSVLLDSGVTWKYQVDKITKKCNAIMYHLRFFRKYTTETLRKRLVEALLFPHLDYCSVVLLNASQELRIRQQVHRSSQNLIGLATHRFEETILYGCTDVENRAYECPGLSSRSLY